MEIMKLISLKNKKKIVDFCFNRNFVKFMCFSLVSVYKNILDMDNFFKFLFELNLILFFHHHL